jgi:hypothetical protein
MAWTASRPTVFGAINLWEIECELDGIKHSVIHIPWLERSKLYGDDDRARVQTGRADCSDRMLIHWFQQVFNAEALSMWGLDPLPSPAKVPLHLCTS